MDGRVKTLHPKIHGGILGRRDLDDHAAADEGARHRADRPRRGQPLSLRGDGRASGAALRRLRREYRHRRAGDDPRGGQEPRLRHGRHRPGATTTTVPRRDDAANGGHQPGAAPAARRRRLCPHRAYDAAIARWFAERARASAFPDRFAVGGPAEAARCATAKTRIRRRRSMSAGRRAPASPAPSRSRARNSATTT